MGSMGGKRSAMMSKNLKIYEQFLLWFLLICAARVSLAATNPSDGKGCLDCVFWVCVSIMILLSVWLLRKCGKLNRNQSH